jgi:putative molybdopterin biosynthesis protein
MLITTKEVAALLRVHPKHVYRLLKRGLPARRVGDEWRFDEHEVMRWARLARGGEGPAPGAPARGDVAPDAAPPLLAGNGDLALEALLDELAARGAPPLGLVQADHGTGLALLRSGAVLLAGCHGDAAPAEVAAGTHAFIHVATRELGLAFPRGARVRRASAIVGRRLAGRPPSAGIRRCLDEALRREGVEPERAYARAKLHPSHRDAVLAVVRGEADVALASRAWAARARLGFLPLASEGYGLALPAADLGDARVVAVCEAAQSGAYRARLGEGLGYDMGRAGEIRFGPRASDTRHRGAGTAGALSP